MGEEEDNDGQTPESYQWSWRLRGCRGRDYVLVVDRTLRSLLPARSMEFGAGTKQAHRWETERGRGAMRTDTRVRARRSPGRMDIRPNEQSLKPRLRLGAEIGMGKEESGK